MLCLFRTVVNYSDLEQISSFYLTAILFGAISAPHKLHTVPLTNITVHFKIVHILSGTSYD